MPCLAHAGQATCTTLPPLMHPDGGSWEPVEQEQHTANTVEACCQLARGKAYTFYPSPFEFCYVDTGNGAREFHVGAPAAYMFPPPPPPPEPEPEPQPEPEPEWKFIVIITRDRLLGGAAALVVVLVVVPNRPVVPFTHSARKHSTPQCTPIIKATKARTPQSFCSGVCSRSSSANS
eukprot:COSAG05_NODE_1458_length_4828_cov_2.893001_2_plen_177_part_00